MKVRGREARWSTAKNGKTIVSPMHQNMHRLLQQPGQIPNISIPPIFDQQRLDCVCRCIPVKDISRVNAAGIQCDQRCDEWRFRPGGSGNIEGVASGGKRAEAGGLTDGHSVKVYIAKDCIDRSAVIGQVADPEAGGVMGGRAGGVCNRSQIQAGRGVDDSDRGHPISDIERFTDVDISVQPSYGEGMISL